VSEQEIIDVIHQALCDDSPEECEEDYGQCLRAGGKVWALIKGENK
jgi:hypothetical protein